MKKESKKLNIALSVLLIVALVVVGALAVRKAIAINKAEQSKNDQFVADMKDYADKQEIAKAEETEVEAFTADTTESAEPDETTTAETATPEATAEEVTSEDIGSERGEVKGAELKQEEAPNVDEYVYKGKATAEDIEQVQSYIEGQNVNIDEMSVEDFWAQHPEILTALIDPRNDLKVIDLDGDLLFPLSSESLIITDEERAKASVNKGLNKEPINDAIAYPFELTDDEVKAILAAKSGTVKGFSDDRIEQLRNELFAELFQNPILAEAWVRLILDQKIGQDVTVSDSWRTGREFVEKYDYARNDGTGMNIWLRKINSEYYTSVEYQKYVMCVVNFLEPLDTKVKVRTANKGDHYNLIPIDLTSMRKAEPANYKDTKTWLAFDFHLKNGKIGLEIGSNLRDKRPGILHNLVTTKKPTPVKKQEDNKKPVATQQPQASSPSSNPSPNPNPNPNPDPNPNPNPDPTPTPKPKPDKDPNDDPAVKGNAPIGGGANDDKGPGTKKPDQGNSKSDKVDESQYQPGTTENKDGGKTESYDPGPASDSTDNGEAPKTEPIETHDSDWGNKKDDSGDHNGKTTAAPVVED